MGVELTLRTFTPRTKGHRARAVLVAVALGAAALVPPSTAGASFSGSNGRIFFRQGSNIYSVNADGTTPTRKLVAAASSFTGTPRLLDVSVNHTGKRIAFSAGGSVWVKTLGYAARNVTKTASTTAGFTQARYPAWSPDGDQLVFQATRKINGYWRNLLYRINLDGTGIKRLHLFDTNLSYHAFPDWSSTDRIVFVNGDYLWVMGPDGLGKRQLTAVDGDYKEPSWSPAGDKIAVTSEIGTTISAPNPGVVVVDAATGAVTAQVTGPADYESHYESPSWSPDGTTIAFIGWQGDSTSPVRKLLKAPAVSGTAAGVQVVYEGLSHSWEPAWGVGS